MNSVFCLVQREAVHYPHASKIYLIADLGPYNISKVASTTARRFLSKVIEEVPFPVTSIQVDGGSAFMAVFEQECEARAIPLFVLPPRPPYNGGVERGNRVFVKNFTTKDTS
jgi:hypothetical protein